ncbi:MAG: ferrous iron transporter B [Candidatus Kappaea frigidicola]|nr:ferrous iron transporter B [Candidatus Kappaea frigidicola]
MKKIVLMGNPNVGKSAIFSRLTGAKVIISNYAGTTVEYTKGYLKTHELKYEIIDVPGTYAIDGSAKSDEVARKMLEGSDLIINVVDATNLERNLYLTIELLEKDVPMIIALNMWDDTKHKGVDIDVKKLEEKLGIPVVCTCGLTAEGIKELVDRLKEAKTAHSKHKNSDDIWKTIGDIVTETQRLSHRHHTLIDRLEDLTIKPATGLPVAAGVIVMSFWIVRFIGEGLINYVLNPIFENFYKPLIMHLSNLLGSESFIHQVVIGSLFEGEIDFGLSFGLLTTGLYVPLVQVLPYILSFYFILGLLEDLGYLPRLGVLVDNLMHRVGLHGYSVISMILGLGCNVPGALSMRILETRRERFIAATLMAIAVPCMAQIAVIIGLVGQRGGMALSIVFLTLFLIWVILGLILNKVLKGNSPEILIEVPPYRFPQLKSLAKKVWMRTQGFLKEALPYVLLGVLVVNILYFLGIVDYLANVFTPVICKLWGLPKETIGALLIGFLRKDVAVGMLGPLNLSDKQLIISSVILAIYFPCVATFMVLVKELGLKDMAKSALIMVLVALLVGGLLNIIL